MTEYELKAIVSKHPLMATMQANLNNDYLLSLCYRYALARLNNDARELLNVKLELKDTFRKIVNSIRPKNDKVLMQVAKDYWTGVMGIMVGIYLLPPILAKLNVESDLFLHPLAVDVSEVSGLSVDMAKFVILVMIKALKNPQSASGSSTTTTAGASPATGPTAPSSSAPSQDAPAGPAQDAGGGMGAGM